MQPVPERAGSDDLFEPSLQGRRRKPLAEGERPWRLGSQFYVAFFGGPLAVAAIAWFNARRLGMPSSRTWLMPVAGLAGLVATVVAAIVVDADLGESQRLVARIAAVATFGVLYLLQRAPDRVYHAFADGDEDDIYDSLWGPGLAATFGLGIVQLIILAAFLET
jgi:hypothetical protein